MRREHCCSLQCFWSVILRADPTLINFWEKAAHSITLFSLLKFIFSLFFSAWLILQLFLPETQNYLSVQFSLRDPKGFFQSIPQLNRKRLSGLSENSFKMKGIRIFSQFFFLNNNVQRLHFASWSKIQSILFISVCNVIPWHLKKMALKNSAYGLGFFFYKQVILM